MSVVIRQALPKIALAAALLGACNYTEGECWLRSEQDGQPGAGGGPIVPGAGGYGSTPPEPQSEDDPPIPDCNITGDSPCNEKCLSKYEADAVGCTKIQDDAQRGACNGSAYAKYKSCRDNCAEQEGDCKKCKLDCDAEHDKCHAKCKTESCHAKCNDVYAKCIKECGACPH